MGRRLEMSTSRRSPVEQGCVSSIGAILQAMLVVVVIVAVVVAVVRYA